MDRKVHFCISRQKNAVSDLSVAPEKSREYIKIERVILSNSGLTIANVVGNFGEIDMVCKAKIDWAIYTFPLLFEIIITVSNICKKTMSVESIIISTLISSIILLFLIVNMLTINYTFSEAELLIKTCMFKSIVKLNQITDVKQERGFYSFSASSYEQLKLIFSDGRKLGISPKDIPAVENYICKRTNQQE